MSIFGKWYKMEFIDSHAHITSPELFPEAEHLLERAKKAHVSHVLNVCTDAESLRLGILLADRYPAIVKNAGAVHPNSVAQEGEAIFQLFEKAAYSKQLCAIGEIGLDYYLGTSSKEMQKQGLRRQLHLASSLKLPVIFHCRNAFSDLFSIADAEYLGPAIVHCFTGSQEEADQALQRGWFLSISGIVTFKKSDLLRDIVKRIPLTQLLIETDAPCLAPQSRRGEQNEPSFLPEIAECIAKIKNISLEDVANATAKNAKALLYPFHFKFT